MPAERFSSSLAPRYCAHFVSAANWTRAREGAKWRQNRRRQKSKNNHVISSLNVGWGGRTRTSEWRNQNPPNSPELSMLILKKHRNSTHSPINGLALYSE